MSGKIDGWSENPSSWKKRRLLWVGAFKRLSNRTERWRSFGVPRLSRWIQSWHLAVKILLLIVLSPIVVVVIAWGVERSYFNDLYRPKAYEAGGWERSRSHGSCSVLGVFGTWVTLDCGDGQLTLAAVAGLQASLDEKSASRIEHQLDQLLSLSGGTNPRVRFSCALVEIRKAAVPTQAKQFASCTLAGQSLTEVMIALGASPALLASPAFVASPVNDQGALQGWTKQADTDKGEAMQAIRRSTALGVQSWVATILGFLGAAFGLLHSGHKQVARGRLLREQLMVSLSEFRVIAFRCNKVSDAEVTDSVWPKATLCLIDLQEKITASKDFEGHGMDVALDNDFRVIRADLENKRSPNVASLSSLYRLVREYIEQ